MPANWPETGSCISFLRAAWNIHVYIYVGFPGGSAVKNPPAMQETRVWSLGQEDALEKEMAIHFSILALKIPWTEEPGGLQSIASQRVRQDWGNLAHAVCKLVSLNTFFWGRTLRVVHLLPIFLSHVGCSEPHTFCLFLTDVRCPHYAWFFSAFCPVETETGHLGSNLK